MFRNRKLIAILITVSFFSGSHRGWPAEVEAYFSPLGGCTLKIVAQIDSATKEVCVAAYQLTEKRICESISRAALRKLRTIVIVDKSMEAMPDPDLMNLIKAGLIIRVDRGEKLFHNKYIIIDGQRVLTGSFNFSDNAELRNAENLIIIKDEPTAIKFIGDFNRHFAHSTQFRPKMANRISDFDRFAFFNFIDKPTSRKEPLKWQKSLGR